MVVFGVDLITAEQIGKELGKSKSDVSKLIAKANLTAIPIKKKRYYSREQFFRSVAESCCFRKTNAKGD